MQLYELYIAVKSAIICAENFDPQREFYLAPLNQLRSTLDHFFKAAVSENNMEYELKEAKEHMNRAGYDALEILAGNVGNSIQEKMRPYNANAIAKIFPDYYKSFVPKIMEIKINIAEIRMRPKDDSEKSFLNYLGDIKVLLDIDKQVTSMIPSLVSYCKKRGRKERVDMLLRIVSPILGVIIGAILTWLLSK